MGIRSKEQLCVLSFVQSMTGLLLCAGTAYWVIVPVAGVFLTPVSASQLACAISAIIVAVLLFWLAELRISDTFYGASGGALFFAGVHCFWLLPEGAVDALIAWALTIGGLGMMIVFSHPGEKDIEHLQKRRWRQT